MLTLAWQLASVAGLWSALQGSVTVSATSRGNARNIGAVDQRTTVDMDVLPALGLSVRDRSLTAALSYAPMFTMRSVFEPAERNQILLHTASASLGYSARGTTFTLTQSGSLGTMAFVGLRTTTLDPAAPTSPTTPRIDLIPTNVQTVRVGNETTAASLGYAWDRRWSTRLNGSYSISGGLDAEAQMALPQLRTGNGTLSVDYLMSRLDRLGASLGMANLRTRGGPQLTRGAEVEHNYWTNSATLNWSHQFQPGLSGQLTLGGLVLRSSDVEDGNRFRPQLTGGVSGSMDFVRRRGLIAALTVGGALAPTPNALTGTFQQRAQGRGDFLLTIDTVTLSVGVDAVQTLPQIEPDAFRIFGGTANLAYNPTPLLTLAVDYRSAWLSSYAAGPAPRQWIVGLVLTLRAPSVSF